MRWVVRGRSGEVELDVERRDDGTFRVRGAVEGTVDLVALDGSIHSLRWVEDDRSYEVVAERGRGSTWRVRIGEREYELEVLSPVEAAEAATGGGSRRGGRLEAPIPGKVVAVRVAPGDRVEPGQTLVVLEAMKMENELAAEAEGTVAAVHVAPGDTVETGEVLVELEG